MKTHIAGEQVPYGLYFAIDAFDYRFCDGEAPLEGKELVRYIRLPMIVTMAALPILGALFYFAFPVLVIGVVSFALFKLVVKPMQTLVSRKMHLTTLHWNPVTAYMKTPVRKLDKAPDKSDAKNKGK